MGEVPAVASLVVIFGIAAYAVVFSRRPNNRRGGSAAAIRMARLARDPGFALDQRIRGTDKRVAHVDRLLISVGLFALTAAGAAGALSSGTRTTERWLTVAILASCAAAVMFMVIRDGQLDLRITRATVSVTNYFRRTTYPTEHVLRFAPGNLYGRSRKTRHGIVLELRDGSTVPVWTFQLGGDFDRDRKRRVLSEVSYALNALLATASPISQDGSAAGPSAGRSSVSPG
jgi:Bacterial PH domain